MYSSCPIAIVRKIKLKLFLKQGARKCLATPAFQRKINNEASTVYLQLACAPEMTRLWFQSNLAAIMESCMMIFVCHEASFSPIHLVANTVAICCSLLPRLSCFICRSRTFFVVCAVQQITQSVTDVVQSMRGRGKPKNYLQSVLRWLI